MVMHDFWATPMSIKSQFFILCMVFLAAPSVLWAALPPWVEEERIATRRASAPEELVLHIETVDVETQLRFVFFGPVVAETHTLKGAIHAVNRSESGLEAGDAFVLKLRLDVREIQRERRAHERKVRRGWVGPAVYFMQAPVFAEGSPDNGNTYKMKAWLQFEGDILKPAAGPHSFGRPERLAAGAE